MKIFDNFLNNEIVLIRGLPGSGKSTLAKSMREYHHFEADMFLVVDEVYVYDQSKVRAAHEWCLESARSALKKGENVVVSNTFLNIWEMQLYVELGFKFKIIEVHGKWKSVHGVPQHKIDMMAKRWEPTPQKWRVPEFC
jgi:predicted kinase